MKPNPETVGPGQESVWDYPRPPRVEPCSDIIRIEFAGTPIVESSAAKRVLETSHPPVYYIPVEEVLEGSLLITDKTSFCEFKGQAHYYHVTADNDICEFAAWTYLNPFPKFAAIRDHVAFYAQMMDRCFVGDREVQPQRGDFYGGWITDNIVGPFKGGPGTMGW